MKKASDIVDTAISAGNFSTLARALGAAGLIETLKGDGPFTVFAPTDDAFARIPAERLSQLLQPENKEKLRAILLCHVVSGKMNAHEVINRDSLQTVQGQEVSVTKDDGIYINYAKVIAPDVIASNGVIHVIDTVLLPHAAATA